MLKADFLSAGSDYPYISAFRFPAAVQGSVVRKQLSACDEFLVYKPRFPLSKFIEQMWIYSGFRPNYVRQNFIPDGSNWLVIDFSDHSREFWTQDGGSRFTCRNSWLTGIFKKFTMICGSPSPSMMGINFKTGGAHAFFKFPQSELTNSAISLDLIWGSEATNLRERLHETRALVERFVLLERAMLSKLRSNFLSGKFLPSVLQQIHASTDHLNLKEIASQVGITQKHFISIFQSHIGLTPKRFHRISRFQKVIQKLESRRIVHWSFLAADFGYYDQAHLIKEFQEFAGVKPSRYSAMKGALPNHIPILPSL
jgi:AraC-like DNA-binding protein